MTKHSVDIQALPPPWNTIMPLLVRILVWGALFGVLFVLRGFFLLIFLTFVFSYIQANGVRKLGRFVPNRSVRVVAVFLVFLSIIFALGNFLVPRVQEQARLFVERLPLYIEAADRGLIELSIKYPSVANLIPSMAAHHEEVPKGQWRVEDSLVAEVARSVLGGDGEQARGKKTAQIIEALQKIGTGVVGAVSAFLLSLLFSFLIVFDLPRLAASVRGLGDTKLAFVYDEVADSILDFGSTVGRAFEAQMYIALLNTLLTAIGLYLLGLGGKTAFLSVIVFICSFIPVAGVFISSVPICLFALQEYGVRSMLLAVLLITVTHMVEAYILNPKIYGHHLRINPVIVLIILTVSGKIFGVWGLLLGVPVCSYIFGHAIRYRGESVPAGA